MIDGDDPFEPRRPMKLATSNRRPVKGRVKKPTLTSLPGCRPAPARPAVDDPFDDPFAVPARAAGGAAIEKQPPVADDHDPFAIPATPTDAAPSPSTPKTAEPWIHRLDDDPFQAPIDLPFIAVGVQRRWQAGSMVTLIDVLEVGLDGSRVIEGFKIDACTEAVIAASRIAASRKLTLLDGVHIFDTIAAFEEGIRAGIAWQRSQEAANA